MIAGLTFSAVGPAILKHCETITALCVQSITTSIRHEQHRHLNYERNSGWQA